MSVGRVVVPLRAGSDGDATHRPANSVYTKDGEGAAAARRNYLEKLGTLWMKSRNEYHPGVAYILERLPAGYEVWGRPRPKDGRMDWYLFGSPFRKTYDSPIQFFPHFKHLMDNEGSNIGCECSSCKPRPSARRNSSGSSSRGGGTSRGRGPHPSFATSRQGSFRSNSYSQPGNTSGTAPGAQTQIQKKNTVPAMDTSRVDEEGTPDVYRHLINKLKKEGTLDEAIIEPLSMDWRAEQECLPKLKEELKMSHKWLPRVGEVVLFVRDLPKKVSIVRDPKSGSFKLFDERTSTLLGYPRWEAGFVGQKPVEQTVLEDTEGTVQWTVAYSGVRVEPLPDLNSTDKILSKQYKYVPLNQTRPLVFWKELLANVTEEDWHPTIKNALTAMSTVSLVDKNHFRGTWPKANIFCSAIFIGPELICVGDAVRLLPFNTGEKCTKILVVKSIRLKLENLDLASDNDYDEGRPYNSAIYLLGKGYTIDQTQSSKEWFTMDDDLPAFMNGYPAHHPLQPPEKQMIVPFSRILGRLYDLNSPFIQPFGDNHGLDPISILDLGRESILEGRELARRTDRRILNTLGSKWYWGDTRADTLDLETVNGLEISKYQPELERNPKKFRQHIKVMEEAEKEAEREQRRLDGKAAFEISRDLRAFMAPPMVQSGTAEQKLPVRNGSTQISEHREMSAGVLLSTEGAGSGGTSVSSGTSWRKRSKKDINLSDNEDEEIHKQARLLNRANEQAKQRTRVEIKVDRQRRV